LTRTNEKVGRRNGMGKAKRRTATTIVMMVITAIIILLLYFYWTNRTEPLKQASVEKLSEVQKLLNKDLEKNYPETPREVVKLHSSMLKTLYTDLKDEDVKALALKIRELYDTEFLEKNPEAQYLQNTYSDIVQWKEKKRRITNYILVNEDLEQESEIDGKKYAVVYVSYTIQENSKFTETWKYLLRLSEDNKWKILGWEFVPQEEQK
jgi:asparagine synthetase B (glutamine-hydrolysing)